RGCVVRDRWLLLRAAPADGAQHTHAAARGADSRGRSVRDHHLLPPQGRAGIGVDAVQRHRRAVSRRADLVALAVELRMGDRHAGRRESAADGNHAADGRAHRPQAHPARDRLSRATNGLVAGAANAREAHGARGGRIPSGWISQAASAGSNRIAANMFTRNMKVSMMPMSAWNFSGENTQVATPIASVMPVKMMLAPVTRSVR